MKTKVLPLRASTIILIIFRTILNIEINVDDNKNISSIYCKFKKSFERLHHKCETNIKFKRKNNILTQKKYQLNCTQFQKNCT